MIRHHNSHRLALVAASVSVIGLSAANAFAHGQIEDSRVYRIAKAGQQANLMGAWTSAMYDWAADSNTFTDYDAAGFEYSWHVPDGTIASAGKNNGANNTLDFAKVNTPGAWPTSPAAAGVSIAQKWVSTAPHDPSYFDVWITKPGFDVTTQTMGWGNLDKLGRWEAGTALDVTTTANGGMSPANTGLNRSYDWTVPIPEGRSGRAALVVVWQRRDSAGEAFFSVQDILIGSAGARWNTTGGGNYGNAGFWDGSVVPNAIGASATFGSKLTASAGVTLNNDTTLGTLRYDTKQSVTLNGNGNMLMLDASTGGASVDVLQGSHTINADVMLHDSTAVSIVGPASTLTLNGSLMFSSGNVLTKTGVGTLRLNPSSVMGASNVTLVAAGGKMLIDKPLSPSIGVFATSGGEAKLSVSQTLNSITMSGAVSKVTLAPEPASSVVVKTNNIGIGGRATLDIGDNVLLNDYSPGNSMLAMFEATARGAVVNDPEYLGGYLTSSLMAANTKMAIGTVEASAIGSPATYMGTAIDNTTVIVRYTLKGDADVNGTVDFNDLVSLAQRYNAAGTWRDGDSDHSGTVDFSDLVSLAQNYNSSMSIDSGALAAIGGSDFAADFALAQSLVPEPATLASLGLVTTLLRRRR